MALLGLVAAFALFRPARSCVSSPLLTTGLSHGLWLMAYG
jgi:hypothetical protein